MKPIHPPTEFDGHCQACLSRIGPNPIPLCHSCFLSLMEVPINDRISRIAELRRLGLLQSLLDRLTELLDQAESVRERIPPWSDQ